MSFFGLEKPTVGTKSLLEQQLNKMTSFSKFFREHIGPLKCQDFLHSETCGEHLKKDILLFTLSNFKYFVPICLLPVLIKIKSMNKQTLRKTLEHYLACSVMGATVGFSINLLMCLIRNIYGRFDYYSLFFIPAVLGSLPLYLGPAQVVNLFEATVFQCMLETFFLMRKNILSRTIANSKFLQTCLFMTCSATILHAKRTYNEPGFWLIAPNKKVHPTDNVEQCPKCDLHAQSSCKQYLIDGMRKCFMFGLTLDLIKMIISQVASTQNQSKFIGRLKKFRIRSVVLLTTYIGIYRLIHCWLNRKGFYSDVRNNIISSFIAGCCYCLYPQPTLFSFAIVQSMQTLWKVIEMETIDVQSKTLKWILSLPYAKIMFPFALANLIHLTVMQPKYVSQLTTTVTNGIANKYTIHIRNELNLLKDKFQFGSITA